MAVCAFKNLVNESSVCGTSSEYTELHCISLKDCNRDVRRHLKLHKISNNEGVNNEMKLLLARAGGGRGTAVFQQTTIFERVDDKPSPPEEESSSFLDEITNPWAFWI
ncbi:Hypothetical predicted protein [Paramuricea clavata]|uniref:Uncharacterized protein n=1 Tax=Paramuricea clavata TaxID=317549 RepID=A0A6S7J1T8_PARCT|nr:Hypothetical predicted protein [Paramuricea clavata]